MSSSASRLMREERDVQNQTVPTIFAQPEETDIHHWRVQTPGHSLRRLLRPHPHPKRPRVAVRGRSRPRRQPRRPLPSPPRLHLLPYSDCAQASDDRRSSRHAVLPWSVPLRHAVPAGLPQLGPKGAHHHHLGRVRPLQPEPVRHWKGAPARAPLRPLPLRPLPPPEQLTQLRRRSPCADRRSSRPQTRALRLRRCSLPELPRPPSPTPGLPFHPRHLARRKLGRGCGRRRSMPERQPRYNRSVPDT